MAEDMGERTEDATPRRLMQARQRGQVAKSQDLAAALLLLGTLAVLVGLAPFSMRQLIRLTELGLGESLAVSQVSELDVAVRPMAVLAAVVLAPLLAAGFVVGVASHMAQIGLLFTTKPLEPKLDRLNPVTGLGRLFSRKNLFKTLVGSVKLVVVAVVATAWVRFRWERVLGLASIEAIPGALALARLALELAVVLALLLLLIGVLDFLYQRWQHKHDLRMTRHEVRDERRSMEGDPEIKGRRFRMMQEVALQRLRHDVPKADVVIANPTHYSVALRYDEGSMRAPRVVAKGVDHLALRIQEIARAHGIMIVERPPLARGLYYAVPEGHEIPSRFYEAVAEVLAYVYRIEREAASRAGAASRASVAERGARIGGAA